MKTWITIVATLIMTLLAPMASAGQLAAVSIINQATGERLPIWRHQGLNYIAGRPGDRYAVEIRNKTDERILSVLSVDGINVLTGSNASPTQAGYVLNTWQTMEVKGWRKNMDEVAAFYFSQLPDSYAARTGRPDNVGVIGIALFREYVEPALVRQEEYSRNSAAATQVPAPAPAITGSMAKRADSAELADSRIGTGHGERLPSAVRSTDFRRATPMANEIISIQYDTYAHLVARGIIPRIRHDQPNPFPGGFVPDPE
ncbi:hypothetical protein ACO0LM_13285 [Undibacterium sp. Di26W]|uniref:hypothetical protein n=1 Tax=Undibacterium sp. Di26W TaxID=3413035 RepID=UPI003BF18411